MPAAARSAIDAFLASKRIAFIGLSHDEKDFSRQLFREFVAHGYEVVPVNPGLAEAEGRPCFSHVGNIVPAVDAVLIMTSAARSESIVRECAAAGVKRVWLYRAVGKGAVSDAAVNACREAGIDVVAGECPFMFLSGDFPHNLHALIKKITFTCPR